MVKLCFFHGGFSLHGGIGRVVSTIANEMANNSNIDVFSLSLYRSQTPNAFRIDKRIHDDYLYQHSISMTKALLTNGVNKICNYIKSNHISHIVACGVLYYPLCVICARLCGIQSICWEHTNPNITDDYRFQKISRVLGANLSNINIVVSREAKGIYDKSFPNKNNVLIWNPAPREAFLNSKDYSVETKGIISVGRLAYPKNFVRLIEIANKLSKLTNDWYWDIYGEGEEREELQRLINHYGLEKKVSLKGAVDDIYKRYSDYSMIVMTSRYEGFPMALIEGAANGLPMVSFDIKTGPSEIINNGENGYLIDPLDDDKMLDAIIKLLDDKNLRSKMSQSAKEKSLEFKIDNVMRLWYQLLGVSNDRII